MTYDEINELIPHVGSLQRARREAWPEGFHIQREGGQPLFMRRYDEDGNLFYERYYEGFCKVFPPESFVHHIVTWRPTKEDKEADDWVLL